MVMRVKIRVLILLNKLITWGAKIAGKNGGVFAGSLLFRRDINALNKIIYPKYVIGVTGSSGKGSTVYTLAKILKSNGYRVIYNETGANAVRGIYTKVLNSTSFWTKKINADVLLLEIDERHISLAFPKPVFTHLVITNITRDQPPRNGHVDKIYQAIMNSIDEKTHFIINADDPVVNEASIIFKGKVTKFGIGKTKYSLTKNNSLCLDHAYCPVCHEKLKYQYYHYGHLGNYSCQNNCFNRNPVLYEATNVDLNNKLIKINNNLIKIDKDAFFAIYYSLAAYAAAATIGLSEEKIINSFNNNILESKRMHSYEYHNRSITMIESKNENNLSYLQSINYINSNPELKTVIIGFDNVSRRYKENDLSWLWDVDFELLNNPKIDKFFCIGKYRYDVFNRLKYAGISPKKLILIEDINDLLNQVVNQSKGDIYTMVCFDMTERILHLIKEDNK